MQSQQSKRNRESGEGQIPKSWHRKVSSPTTSHERNKIKHPALILNRLFNVRGTPSKFQESAREPHPLQNDLILNSNISSWEAYYQARRTLTARRGPHSVNRTTLTSVPQQFRENTLSSWRKQSSQSRENEEKFFNFTQKLDIISSSSNSEELVLRDQESWLILIELKFLMKQHLCRSCR